jgi:tetratricopeptide (TPR) repeat protein
LADPRVVEALTRDAAGRIVAKGSGYLLGAGRVLTAGHVVVPEGMVVDGLRWQVRSLGTETFVDASKVWRADRFDVAVLQLPGDGYGAVDRVPVRLGVLGGRERVPCRTVGFPTARTRTDQVSGLQVRDPEPVQGTVDPQSAAKRPLATLHITGSVPEPLPVAADGSRRSPWAGMSGAAVFTAGRLVGVVVVDPERFGPDRLGVQLLGPLRGDAESADALAAGHAWQEADWPEALEVPYRPAVVSRDAARLLRAGYGVVPFIDRPELGVLRDWCQGEERVSVWLITGAGGQGKTRLAAELCQQVLDAGWVAGFARRGDFAARIERLAQLSSPLLVVVDDAETRPGEVVQLLDVLVRGEADRLRVLLLARSAGPWWEQLGYGASDDAEEVVALAAHLALPSLVDPPDARAAAYAAAVTAFARHLQVPDPTRSGPDLSDPVFAHLLFVHMAALTAVDPPASGPTLGTGPVRDELLRKVLELEEQYFWRPTAEHAHIDGLIDATGRRRAVAVATLTRADAESDAVTALAVLPELAGRPEGDVVKVARWLAGLSDGDGYLHPLAPDLLGEALVATVLDDLPTLADRLLTAGLAAEPILTVLIRAASHHPSAFNVLALLIDRPEHAALTADSFPMDTVALAELAAVAAQTALTRLDRCGGDNDTTKERAWLLNNLSNRLANVGRREDALAAAEKAVDAYQRLTDARPDAFLPDLAMSLNTLARSLSSLGRPEDALAALERAVDAYQRLADARPEVFMPDLAGSENNLAVLLAGVGRGEDALAAAEKAVDAYQRLADARPDAFAPDLATSLNNLAAHLSRVGRREDALAASEKAVDVYQRLADTRPDAFLPSLAASLNNLAAHLSGVGRREEALAAIEQAVDAYRRLADARPEVFLPELATTLNNLSLGLAEGERREDALAAIEQAVHIRRELAHARPDAFEPDLATSLNNMAAHLSGVGRLEDALAVAQEAVDAYRRLADARPEMFLPELERSLDNLSILLAGAGRRVNALMISLEAEDIRGQRP